MFISVDPNSVEPLYLQIYGAIVSAIALGEIGAGNVLPSSRRLALDLGINYHTVNKAYNLLEMEGFVSTQKKRVVVIATTQENRDEFIKKWRSLEMEMVKEALAKGIGKDELSAMFKKLLESVEGPP